MKQKADNKTFDLEDIILWSDNTWCYRYELHEMNHMSDDYQTLFFDTKEYNDFLLTQGW